MAQRLPRVPDIGNRLPRLESLFSPDTAPLTTSMADAPMPLHCLDSFPADALRMAALPRAAAQRRVAAQAGTL